MLYEWAANTSVENASHELEISKKTVQSFFKKTRSIASCFITNRLRDQIGGDASIIEIDECQLGRRKYHRGRRQKEIWVFGAIDRNTVPPVFFMEIVKRRNKKTMHEIINRRIAQSSTIKSDGWASY